MSDFFNFDTSDNVFNNLKSDDMSIQKDLDVVKGESLPDYTDPPAKKKADSFDRMINQTNDSFFKDLSTPLPQTEQSLKGSGIQTVNPENVEKFKAQKGYDALNFNPYATETNTQKAIQNETWSTAMAKGFDTFLYNAGNTYTSWFSDYGKMADAISSGDWDAIKPTENELINQYYLDQKNANKNYVFAPEEDNDGIFNKKFFSDFLGNVGFTYGTIAAMGTELAADAIITGLTGGAGFETFGATIGKLATKLGVKEAAKEGVELAAKKNFFSSVTEFGRGLSLADKPIEALKPLMREATEAELMATSKIPTATGREIFNSYLKMFSNNILNISKSKSAGEFAKNILKGTPLLGTGIEIGEKIGIATKAGATGAELFGMGAQGLRRVAQELNMSISEATFESVSTYGDTLDMMIKNHQDTHGGELPNADQFNKMRDYAVKASSSNYDTNTAILLATNKLQFGNLFNKFIPANVAMHTIESTMAENAVVAVGKKGAFKIFDKSGFFGTFGILGQVSSEFGKKEAAKLIGKSFLRNSLSFELAEGAQEIYQNISASAWKKYYSDKYSGNTGHTLSEAFGQGFNEQLSAEGWKTFLTGAMTGMLVKGPSKIMNRAVEKSQEAYYNNKYKTNPTENPFNNAKEQLKSDIQMINSVFKAGGPNAFSNKVVNFNQQIVSALHMSEAASKGLQYEFKNNKDNALLAATMAAYRTNTIKGFTNAIKEMGVDFTAEDFKKEFNIDLADTTYETPQQFTEKVAADLTKYTKIIEDVTRGVKNRMIDVNDYIPGTQDRIIANHARKAQEEAISIVALNAIKTDMTGKRIKELNQDLAKITGLEHSSDYAMRVLSDPIFLDNEIKTVGYQIKQLNATLAQGLTGQVKTDTEKELKAAEKEQELLNTWKTLWKQRSEITNNPEDTEHVFVGKTINKKQRVLNADGKKLWTAVETYDIKHKDVVKLFKQIIDIKNKQAGINTELSQTSLNDGFEKIADYIRLSRDNKDYMQAVEVLSDPEKFMSMHKKSTDGLYKYNIEEFFNNINRSILEAAKIIANNVSDDPQEVVTIAMDVANTIITKIHESEAYNALVAIVTDPTLGIETAKESEKYINQIQSIISLELHKIIKKYSPEEIGLDIKEGELNDILTNKEMSDFRLLSIAEKLMNNTELLPNEKKVLEDPVIQMNVDMKVAELKYVGYTPAVQVVENEDGSADVVDTNTGEKLNQEPLTTEQAEDLKSKVDSLPTEEVINNEIQTPAPATKVEDDTEFAQATNYEDQSDFDLLNSFTNSSDANKIATLEALREYNAEYKALKLQFGKQLISKDQYQAELDKINAKIYVPGAEKITLKSLLDKNKVVTEPGANNNPNAPQQSVQQPASNIKTNKADIERRRQAELEENKKLSVQDLKTKVADEFDTLEETRNKLKQEVSDDASLSEQDKELLTTAIDGIFNIPGSNPYIIDDYEGYAAYDPKKFEEYMLYNFPNLTKDQIRNVLSKNIVKQISTQHSASLLASLEGPSGLPNNLAELNADKINAKYDAELAALKGNSTTQSDLVTVYHHTNVDPKDFNFGNFQRGKDQISQFGDGLNASSTTTPFFVKRYGKAIKGEIKDSDFIVIDANKSEKELYEYLVNKGYKFNNPMTGSYIGKSAAKEYDSTEKANNNPAVIALFNDFQKSNPQVKGVKVINHIIGTEKVDPFYVIYDSKSFYGPGSLSKTESKSGLTIDEVFGGALEGAEELVREMVKPNGKKITDFTSDEQRLISTVSVARKQEIQAEEVKLAEEKENEKIKQDPEYDDFTDDGDTGEDVSTLFGDKTADKLKMVKQNREFAAEYLGTNDESKIIEFISRANIVLDNLNEKKKSNLESLRMLSKIKTETSTIESIRDNIMKNDLSDEEDTFDEGVGTDVNDILKALKNDVQEESKLSVNEESSNNIQNIDIQSILEDYKQAKVDNSKKISKFVKKGDQSLLDEINDINDEPGC